MEDISLETEAVMADCKLSFTSLLQSQLCWLVEMELSEWETPFCFMTVRQHAA